MSLHPISLALRFLLELAALIALGLWGAHQAGIALALALPATAAALWGIFAVPGDPSRSGKAPVPVSGRAGQRTHIVRPIRAAERSFGA